MHRENSMPLYGLGMSSASVLTLLEVLTVAGAVDRMAVVFRDKTRTWTHQIILTCLNNELIMEKSFVDYFNGRKRTKKMLMITPKGLRFLRDNSDPNSWQGNIDCGLGDKAIQPFNDRHIDRVPVYVRKGNALLFVISAGFVVTDYPVSGDLTDVQALRKKFLSSPYEDKMVVEVNDDNTGTNAQESTLTQVGKPLLLSGIRKKAALARSAKADIYSNEIVSYYFTTEEILQFIQIGKFAPGFTGVMTGPHNTVAIYHAMYDGVRIKKSMLDDVKILGGFCDSVSPYKTQKEGGSISLGFCWLFYDNATNFECIVQNKYGGVPDEELLKKVNYQFLCPLSEAGSRFLRMIATNPPAVLSSEIKRYAIEELGLRPYSGCDKRMRELFEFEDADGVPVFNGVLMGLRSLLALDRFVRDQSLNDGEGEKMFRVYCADFQAKHYLSVWTKDYVPSKRGGDNRKNPPVKIKNTKKAETKWKRLVSSAMKEGVSVEDYASAHNIDMNEILETNKPAKEEPPSRTVVWAMDNNCYIFEHPDLEKTYGKEVI